MLADSTFNPATVDELACLRGGGDAVVHYGRAEAPLLSDDDDEEEEEEEDDGNAAAVPVSSLSSSCSLPTLFVFGRQKIHVAAVARAVVEHARGLVGDSPAAAVSAVVVLPDQPLSHAAGALRAEMRALAASAAAAAAAAAADAADDDADDDAGGEEFSDERRRRKKPSGPVVVVVAAPAFRAVEPRAAAAAAAKNEEEEDEEKKTEGGRGKSSKKRFDAREPSRSWTLGGLTWRLPFAAPASSCAFVWVGPGDEDEREEEGAKGERGEKNENGSSDEACSSARQLLRLSLSSSAAGGWATVDPVSGKLRVPPALGTRRLLGRRYFAVQKAANAALVGIVIATSAGGEKEGMEEEGQERSAPPPSPSPPPSKSVPAHIAASDALLRLARAAGKRPYSLSMGRPTAAKLSNFPELGAFVLVAPPGGQLPPPGTLEALAPVLTPAEAVVAWGCGSGNGREGEDGSEEEEEGDDESEADEPASRWDPSSYSLDSLPAVAAAATAAAEALERRNRRRRERGAAAGEEDGVGGGVARLSLVDGANYHSRPFFCSSPPNPSASSSPPSPSQQLAVRQDGSLTDVSNGSKKDLTRAADFLASHRSWRGLETPATGGVPAAEAALAVEGRSGRAAGYDGEGAG